MSKPLPLPGEIWVFKSEVISVEEEYEIVKVYGIDDLDYVDLKDKSGEIADRYPLDLFKSTDFWQRKSVYDAPDEPPETEVIEI